MKFTSGITLPQLPKSEKDLKSWSAALHKALHQLISNITGVLSRAIVYDDAGNVGIGTDSPSHPLTVQAAVDGTDNIAWRSADGTLLGCLGSQGASLPGSKRAWVGLLGDGGSYEIEFYANGYSYIKGRVGIGTTSPGAHLDIAGARADWAGAAIRLTSTETGAQTYGAYIAADDSLKIGDVTHTRDNIILFANGNVCLAPTAGGVGIGTASPNATLDVHGDIRINSDETADDTIEAVKTSGRLKIYTGTAWNTGPGFELHGDGFTAREGAVWIFAGYGGGNGKGVQFASIDSGGDYDVTLVIHNNGNVGLGGITAFGTSAARTLGIGAGTAPSAAPADMIHAWVEDVNGAAGYAGLHKMTETTAQKEIVPGIIRKTDTGDPSNPYEGLMTINTADNKFKVYADGAWRQCATWT